MREKEILQTINKDSIGKLDLQKLTEAKNKGLKIGLVQGSWDLFHVGHLRYILKARELCDYLIIGMDSDEKIRKRKGPSRPVIPEEERYDFINLLKIADDIVIKDVNERKWGLIRDVKPDVLIAIKDNYSDEEIEKLNEICGRVAILPRQSESSTSDKIRKITISNRKNQIGDLDKKVNEAIEEFKERINYTPDMQEPIPKMVEQLKDSTDWVCPVAVACYHDGRWYLGSNHTDFDIPKYDIDNRTELYYSTVEHAEMNLLKKLGDVETLEDPIWTTLFPCDKCMKTLINKGVKKIYYLEDHPERNWSKRSHELALKHGVETINILNNNEIEITEDIDYNSFKYIYPPNARKQEQLDIMMNMENDNKDPLDPNYIEQDILFVANYWYVSKNRFPHQSTGEQYLIIAKDAIYDINDMSEEMWQELYNIWIVLTKKYNILGGALCFRFGNQELSGASLKRLHTHLIMPTDEKVRFPVGGHKTLKKGLYINNNNNKRLND